MHKSTYYPTFGSWLKDTWLDFLTLLSLGAIGLAAFLAPPLFNHRFPIWNHDGEIVYPQYDYPYRDPIIPTWLSVVLSISIPVAVILLTQWEVRSLHDLSNAILGLSYALLTGAAFQSVLKWFVGGLRPHFYAVCQPRHIVGDAQSPARLAWFDHTICTNPDTRAVEEARQSFPSGHTQAAFVAAVYLALYWNGKFKVWSEQRARHWKLVMLCVPLLAAMLVGASMIVDGSHHWYDVLAGGLMGTLLAVAAYRMMYASVFDSRINHVPLGK
ncbi:hypothetical protein LTR62_005810 [Meristemomyces frigidus]|uniref:Phosphatidic acid phosphatase type 2/haloperoxidase domain-containing protein n=1 Tax=Meristemomyces frigidus TaxID=1508187 RepID=A0AAN7TD38_9PEZI|nr:hypothetical protein LTR62_005810 [Meristemomyces frigidus]